MGKKSMGQIKGAGKAPNSCASSVPGRGTSPIRREDVIMCVWSDPFLALLTKYEK